MAFQQLSGEMLPPVLFSVCFTAGQCNELYFGGWNEGPKPSPAAVKSLEEIPENRSQQASCRHLPQDAPGASGDRTQQCAKLGAGGFRAVRHKLGMRVLGVNETCIYNLSVTILSIPSSTPESDPVHKDGISHSLGL